MGGHELTLRGSFSPNSVTRIPEVSGLDGGYFQMGLNLQYNLRLVDTDGHFAGGPLFDLGYNFIGGDEGNLGSHRHSGEFLVGWRQHFSRFFFIDIEAGIGPAWNYLNFGRGYPLQEETTFNFITQVVAGAQVCFGDFCPGIFGGYRYERSLSGPIEYENQGPVFGLQFAIDPVQQQEGEPSDERSTPSEPECQPRIIEVNGERVLQSCPR